MACPPPRSSSYTVVIIPLRTSLYSLDALRFYLWIQHLKDLEKEKDALCCGLEILEKARLWYLQRLEENTVRQENCETTGRDRGNEVQSCLLRACIQRVNGSLGSVMTEPSVSPLSDPPQSDRLTDIALRWQNTQLTMEVSEKNRQISMLEMENDALLEQLEL